MFRSGLDELGLEQEVALDAAVFCCCCFVLVGWVFLAL